MRVLVTGFGPFPGVPKNPSQSVVERLPDRIGRASLIRSVLPTEYGAAASLIEELVVGTRPDLCICTGVGRGDEWRLERMARNLGSIAEPDNAGAIFAGPVEPHGPESYRSTLPLHTMISALQARGDRVCFSDDAGGYLCNYVFYKARHISTQAGLSLPCGFLHLPDTRNGQEDAERIESMVDALVTMIGVAISAASSKQMV